MTAYRVTIVPPAGDPYEAPAPSGGWSAATATMHARCAGYSVGTVIAIERRSGKAWAPWRRYVVGEDGRAMLAC